MIEYLKYEKRFTKSLLTKLINEEQRKRFEIVDDMINQIRFNSIGYYEYKGMNGNRYSLHIESKQITLVTPNMIYIKSRILH